MMPKKKTLALKAGVLKKRKLNKMLRKGGPKRGKRMDTAELDKDLENYWLKNNDKENGNPHLLRFISFS